MGHTTLRLLLVLVIMIFSASPDKAEAAEIPSQPVLGGTQGGVPPCSSPASTNSTCGINRTLVYRATIDHTQPTAFIFDWADGTTLRDPETGFANAVNGVVQGAFVLHHWVAAGIFGVTITAIDNLGDTSTSAPVEITILPPPGCGNGSCDSSESCSNCAVDCGACPPPCTDGVCEPGETCVTCSPDCGMCTHAGNTTIDGFTEQIGMLRVGGSQQWQVTNPAGVVLANSTATVYRREGVVSGQSSVESLWFQLRSPEQMAQFDWSTVPVEIDGNNRLTLSNPDSSTWTFGTWTFFVAWDMSDGSAVVTPLTQLIVPAVAAELSPEAQDPWSLFGGFAQTNGHAQGYSTSECPFFESVTSQMAYYIPWDPCPVGQDCIASFSYIFSVYEYSDGWTAVARPTLVTGVNNQAGEVGRSFEELGNYFVSATLWDASMTNPSNTLSSEFHIRELKPECPNARCDGFETFSSCPEDCPASCGDGVCGAGEDCTNCKADCDGGPGENLCTPSPSCGNGICECISSSTIPPPSGETSANCPTDCGTSQLDQSADPVSTLDRWATLLLCAALVGVTALRADRKFKLRSTSTTSTAHTELMAAGRHTKRYGRSYPSE